MKGDKGESGLGEWSGRPGLWGPGEAGDIGPVE